MELQKLPLLITTNLHFTIFLFFPQLEYRKSCSKNAFFYCNGSFQYQPSPYLWPSVYWLFHALDCHCIAVLQYWKIFFQYNNNWEQLFSINQSITYLMIILAKTILKPYLFPRPNLTNVIISLIISWAISWQIIPYKIERWL